MLSQSPKKPQMGHFLKWGFSSDLMQTEQGCLTTLCDIHPRCQCNCVGLGHRYMQHNPKKSIFFWVIPRRQTSSGQHSPTAGNFFSFLMREDDGLLFAGQKSAFACYPFHPEAATGVGEEVSGATAGKLFIPGLSRLERLGWGAGVDWTELWAGPPDCSQGPAGAAPGGNGCASVAREAGKCLSSPPPLPRHGAPLTFCVCVPIPRTLFDVFLPSRCVLHHIGTESLLFAKSTVFQCLGFWQNKAQMAPTSPATHRNIIKKQGDIEHSAGTFL